MSLLLQDITHRYGSHESLRRVSIRVEPGDCYGFIGHNGAGKTTTLRIALGLMRQGSGRVFVDGFDAGRFPREARARMGGLVEVPGFYGFATGFENLVQLGKLQGLGGAQARREAQRQLERVGLSAAGGRKVKGYSQGMRQRLGLAQAMLGDPAYVLLDEPTANLDPEGIAELREVIRGLAREEGMGVVFCSHHLHEVEGMCNRVGLLREGVMLVEEETETLRSSARGRYLVSTDRDREAQRVLDGLGIGWSKEGEDGLVADLAEQGTGALVRELVKADVELRVLSPRPTTLEEVYLRAAEGEFGAVGGWDVPGSDGVPRERLAPRFPVCRMLRYEVTRVLERLAFPLAVALPGVLAASRIMDRRASKDQDIEQVLRGELFDTEIVTAYGALGLGMESSLFLVMLFVVGLASQSLAGDLSSGTLRNVLLRPLRRVQVAGGKALGQGLALLSFYGFALLASWAAAVWCFDFEDLVYFSQGDPELIVKGSELKTLLPGLLLHPLWPLLAYLGIGFLAGAVVRKGVGALGLALGMVLLLDQLRILGGEWLYLLPSAYLPSPSGDATSYLPYYLEVNAGQLGARFGFASTAMWVPLTWSVVTLSLAALVLQRRSVP